MKFAALSPNAPPVPDVVEAAAKRADARAVYRSSISTYTPAVSSTPTIGIGVGGVGGSGSYGGGYRGGSVGGGITLPVGGGTPNEAFASDTAIVDVATGKLDVVGPLNQPGRFRHHIAACRLDARHIRGAFRHWADLASYVL